MTGGFGTLVPVYMNLVNSVRRNGNRGPEPKLMNNIQSGQFAKTAYVDPNDPSIIYLEQPSVITLVNL